jgi:hypothetical protein
MSPAVPVSGLYSPVVDENRLRGAPSAGRQVADGREDRKVAD